MEMRLFFVLTEFERHSAAQAKARQCVFEYKFGTKIKKCRNCIDKNDFRYYVI